MKWHSFRLRIALLSALLAGTALVGFGLVSWFLIYKTKLARFDSEIKSHLLRESSSPRPVEHWPLYENALPSFFGVNSQTAIALLVIDVDGNTVFKSTSWPSDLEQKTLFPDQFAFNLPLFPPPEGHRPPPRLYPPPPPREGEDFPPEWSPGIAPEPPPEPEQLRNNEERSKLSPMMKHHSALGNWRVGGVTAPFVRIAIAVRFEQVEREMSAISNIFLISIPLILILIAISAWFLSGSALKPLRKVTATLQKVTAKGLDQRIPVETVDIEFLEQIEVFNQMMERLERSFQQASRFSADAAHELKTPLAILQGELERALQQAESGSQLQQTLSSLIDEVRRLGSIVRKLLLLSLADAGQMRVHQSEVDLSEILQTLAEDIELLDPDLTVKLQMQPGLRIRGDRDLLIQVLQNLITNAVKYNVPFGWVQIETKCNQLIVSVTVSNSSQDIPVGDRERIFNRFHRGDPAHTRNIEGLGLGLSLSREIARAHSGELKLELTPPGQTAFTLRFPSNRPIPSILESGG